MTHRIPIHAWLVLTGAWLAPGVALAQVPAVYPVEGTLYDEDGALREGEATLVLQVYEAPTGGEPVFEEEHVATLEEGRFVVLLGSVETLELSTYRIDEPLYLTVSVDGAPETERFPVGVVSHAARAGSAQDAEALGGVPASGYATAAHRHSFASDVTDLPASFPPAAHDVAWSDLTDVPATFAPDAHAIAWSDLTDVPGPWADGDQDGGGDITGVSGAGGLFGGSTSGEATLSVSPGGVTGAHVAAGAVTGDDVNPTSIQRRITGACAPGTYIHAIAEDGSVTCVRPVRGSCSTRTCFDPSSGAASSCYGFAATGVDLQDIGGDGTDADRLVRVAYCSQEFAP